ncbi:MAG: hypothetical protein K0Q73_8410 [Paenibacillus sp.]|nr:hypothetical protein [Paenibacillus sp.]
MLWGKSKSRESASDAGLGAVTGQGQVTCCSPFCAFLQTRGWRKKLQEPPEPAEGRQSEQVVVFMNLIHVVDRLKKGSYLKNE